MAENPRQWQQFTGKNADVRDGDCEAEPVPALWFQDDDDMNSESGFIERFWLPLAVAVLAGWGSITFVLLNAFGWTVILAIAGVVVAGSAAAVALVKTGDRDIAEFPAKSNAEPEDGQFRNAA